MLTSAKNKPAALTKQRVSAQRSAARKSSARTAFLADSRLKGSQFSGGVVQVALQIVGSGTPLRTTARILKWLLPLLGLGSRTPGYHALRLWQLRVGLQQLQRPLERADDWVWIVDHTQQVGAQKVFLILGLRLAEWTGAEPLQHHDVQLLALEPVTTSTGEVVCEQFAQLAAKLGVPRCVVSDNGPDLRCGVRLFRGQHPQVAWVYDIKHRCAILLKQELEKDERWSQFTAAVNRSKQQCSVTNLAVLLPPSQRGKARYLNLQELLAWSVKVLKVLDDPQLLKNTGVEPADCERRFGWLRDYREVVQAWAAAMRVIELTESHVRRHGVYRGVDALLRPLLDAAATGGPSRRLKDQLLQHLAEQALQVHGDEHLPASSEVIESLFGKYKHLQGEQGHHGLTSLILSLGTMLARDLPAAISAALPAVSTSALFRWCRQSLGNTLQACRQYLAQNLRKPKPSPQPT